MERAHDLWWLRAGENECSQQEEEGESREGERGVFSL